MSILPTQPATALPADVRAAGPKAEQLYQTALGFEQLLVQQLTQALQSTTNSDGSDDGSGDSSDASTSMFSQMLPGAFSQGVTAAGGVGIARQLYDSLKTEAGITTAAPTVEPHT